MQRVEGGRRQEEGLSLLGLLKFEVELQEGWRGKPRPGSSLAGKTGALRAADSHFHIDIHCLLN